MNRESLGVEVQPPEPETKFKTCDGCGGRTSAFQRDTSYCTCGSATTRMMLVTLRAIATELKLIREVAERSEDWSDRQHKNLF